MKKRNHPRLASPSAISAERSSSTLLYILLTIACAAFLATGFFFAARQHFAAMDLGMKNSKLRKQIEEMETQQRQLVLAREMVRSPAEMKRIAANKGFRQREALIVPVAASVPAAVKPLIERTSMTKPAEADPKPIKAFLPSATRPTGQGFDARPRVAVQKKEDRTSKLR
jgi:hypothetical protein